MPEKFKPAKSETSDLAVLELKADLNSEQREYLEVLKDKMKKILGGKTKEQLAKAGDLATLKNYKNVLDDILEFLETKEIKEGELEKKFELKKQYDEQVKTLREVEILEKLSNGNWGIKDMLGQERPIPSYEEIRERMKAETEMLDKKREQGFTRLLLVPIGMKLSEIVDKAGKLIIKKHKDGKLLGTDGTKLELDENQPIYVDDIYKDADVKGDLVYGVKKFDKVNHGGKTKEELLKDKDNPNPGWQVMFIEDMPDLPAQGKGKEIEGRKQLEANQSPEQYLETIQTDKQYQGEQFTTPEAQLIYLLQYLQNHNQMIDDWDGKGKSCWNAGAYFKSGLVPNGRWNRSSKRFDLYGNFPVNRDDYDTVRSSVGV